MLDKNNKNNDKYWTGNLSSVGKFTEKKFPIILQMEEVFKGQNKKFKIKDIFAPDEPKKIDILEEYIPTLKKCEINTETSRIPYKKVKSTLEFGYKIQNQNPKLLFHNQHYLNKSKKKRRIIIESDCCKYVPKYDYVKPRILTGPNWKYLSGRKEQKKINDRRNFRICDNENLKSTCLVNMNKTTERGEFINDTNIKIKNDQTFIHQKDLLTEQTKKMNLFIDLSDVNKKYFINNFKDALSSVKSNNLKKCKNVLSNALKKCTQKVTKIITSKPYLTSTNFYRKNTFSTTSDNLDNIDKSDKSFSINLKKNKKNSEKTSIRHTRCGTFGSSYSKSSRSFYCRNHAVDFKKVISREKVEKAKGNKTNNIPYMIPNYSLVEERNAVMVVYKKKKKLIKHKENFEGVDYKISYNPDKILNKCNNHIDSKCVNFKLMSSRPLKKNSPLPSFMQNVHTRGSVAEITDKTLKLNKFSDADYQAATSDFFPKKSYNKIININLINSRDFNEKMSDEFIEKKKINLKKEIKIRGKNNDRVINKLLKEGDLNRFDNITCRSFNKRKKLD